VIGVLPPEFTFVRNEAAAPPQRVDAYIPFDVLLSATEKARAAAQGLQLETTPASDLENELADSLAVANMLNGQTRQPITSLAYFAPLIEEVGQPQIPASYWDHVWRRMEEMEKRWVQMANSSPAAARLTEPSPPEML
jgi:hypothetical protein